VQPVLLDHKDHRVILVQLVQVVFKAKLVQQVQVACKVKLVPPVHQA
jgi:hypothetical protein